MNAVIPPEPTKICTKCGHRKPLNEFHHATSRKDGRRGACRLCENAAARAYRARHGEEVRRREQGYGKEIDPGSGTRNFSVTLLFCPNDRSSGLPLFEFPRKFDRLGFQTTLKMGHWPTGSVFRYAEISKGKKELWRVNGKHLRKIYKNENWRSV